MSSLTLSSPTIVQEFAAFDYTVEVLPSGKIFISISQEVFPIEDFDTVYIRIGNTRRQYTLLRQDFDGYTTRIYLV